MISALFREPMSIDRRSMEVTGYPPLSAVRRKHAYHAEENPPYARQRTEAAGQFA